MRIPSQLGGDGRVQLAFPNSGRFVVTIMPGGPSHVHQTEYSAVLQDITAMDCQVLSHTLRLIESFWHKFQQRRSCGGNPEGGFAMTKLEQAILEGGRLGRRYIRCYEQSSD